MAAISWMRLGGLQLKNNLQLGGFCLPTSGSCPEVERVAAAVQTKIPESQNVVAATRESGKGYSARKSRTVGTPLL